MKACLPTASSSGAAPSPRLRTHDTVFIEACRTRHPSTPRSPTDTDTFGELAGRMTGASGDGVAAGIRK